MLTSQGLWEESRQAGWEYQTGLAHQFRGPEGSELVSLANAGSFPSIVTGVSELLAYEQSCGGSCRKPWACIGLTLLLLTHTSVTQVQLD